jgi:hypothetical protein
MISNDTTPRDNVVKFIATEVCDAGDDLATMPHANDNSCPYCGGALAPGDKASDCSSFEFRAPRLTPHAWRVLDELMVGPRLMRKTNDQK